MRHADTALRRLACCLPVALCILHCATPSFAQPAVITDVVLEQEGRTVTDAAIMDLVETRPGRPFEVADARETIDHLMSLNRFDGVEVYTEPAGTGIRVRYRLNPLHPIDRVEFEGVLGLSEDSLRRLVADRFGASPAPGRTAEVVEALRAEYRRRGYAAANVTTRLVETHDPDRATLFFDINAGRRQTITDVRITQIDADRQSTLAERPDIKSGQPFDQEAIDRALRSWEADLHGRAYYEARASYGVQPTDDGVFVSISLTQGPRVRVTFTGDPLPEADRDRLVRIRAEGSADEDLLEDASRAIEAYLHDRGYRDARATYTREEGERDLAIVFSVVRGPRYLVRTVSLSGNGTITDGELLPLVALDAGRPFVRSALTGGIGAIERLYRARGFTRVQVKPDEVVQVPERDSEPDRHIDVRVLVQEGARTLVRAIRFEGNTAIDEPRLRGITRMTTGQPYSDAAVAADRQRIDLEYRDRGYDAVVVASEPTLTDGGTQADVLFRIAEGPQIVVDHIIIIGNQRINTETIRRELVIREGEPLGYSALNESRTKLAALSLFRRAQIRPVTHGGDPRRDVIVEVEEAPPTVVDFGGGLEGGYVLKVGEGGLAEESLEVAPRGFFQVTRRNLWGKNRSVNLFTRLSLRRNETTTVVPPALAEPEQGRFYEYRILAQYREPRAFETAADLLVTGIMEQAKRSSFNFIRREIRSEVGLRLSRVYSTVAVYSFQKITLLDERYPPDQQPIIDRLFPRVRLSKVSGSLIRDTRDDPIDASRGTFMVGEAEMAARLLGSEVGFVQTYLQGFYYRRLPARRRVVLALGARVGLAHGFTRDVEGEIVQDLPASERFFAGGDTSVRGFSLDRLGDERTITPSGFPTGGNSVVVLNSELRVGVTGALHAIGFLDAGNVFPRASDLDVTDLRPAAGFGVMYRSPVGPIRVDLGFNLHPRMLVPGTIEKRPVLHILLGQAF
jgi:outer membrane protein insertion porin family